MEEEKQETIAQKAKRLLSEVPKEDWIIGEFTNLNGKCCALGHWNRLNRDPNDYSSKNCSNEFEGDMDLRSFTVRFMREKHNLYTNIAGVNNEDFYNGYTEDNPKDRVLHLLDDMIANNY